MFEIQLWIILILISNSLSTKTASILLNKDFREGCKPFSAIHDIIQRDRNQWFTNWGKAKDNLRLYYVGGEKK